MDTTSKIAGIGWVAESRGRCAGRLIAAVGTGDCDSTPRLATVAADERPLLVMTNEHGLPTATFPQVEDTDEDSE